MMPYYEDRWTGGVRSQSELRRMAERGELSGFQVSRRFRALSWPCCRVLEEAEGVAALADQDYGLFLE